MAMLVAQFAFGIPITFSFVYVLTPLYGKASQTYRAIIAGALPLVTAIPKVIVRLSAQRIDFCTSRSFAHAVKRTPQRFRHRFLRYASRSGPVWNQTFYSSQLRAWCNRLAGKVIRIYLWYFVYKKLKRDERETILKANQFRSPRSMRFVADMSIQMILGESTSLIAAVGFIQLYNFMYNRNGAWCKRFYWIFQRYWWQSLCDFSQCEVYNFVAIRAAVDSLSEYWKWTPFCYISIGLVCVNKFRVKWCP